MKVRKLFIRNFRGAFEGDVSLGSGHTLLLGGNNIGKSTVCEALDLVLGPERLARRPVIDEHDFFCGKYLDSDGNPIEIQITAVLTELSNEAETRFYRHLRAWDEAVGDFVEGKPNADTESPKVRWALPVTFIGRYDKSEDDFVGNTFFEHPVEQAEDDEISEAPLGAGRKNFGRDHKRLCGFIYLRAYRTGTRALSLQRGSLLDTILRIGAGGPSEMWENTLRRLQDFTPGIGDIAQLKGVRTELESRMSRFVRLAEGEQITSFFASDLTREHLREVVSLFIAAHPESHLLPFERLGTGSLNLLVFALLTYIAELKDKQSVIFAMEEPEIALAPHTQRRVTRFALDEMGQVIATSHSPYVIEQFEPDRIVLLERDEKGRLHGRPALDSGLAPKGYRRQRRQFAEALLANAVLVLEGGTEVALFREAANILERSQGPDSYLHPDLAGLTFFDASGDGNVPALGPVFKALNKTAFAFCDFPNTPFDSTKLQQLTDFQKHSVSPAKRIEDLLVAEVDVNTQRRFLLQAKDRADYPSGVKQPADNLNDDEVRKLVLELLLARKGEASGYSALLVGACRNDSELPKTVSDILVSIHSHLNPPPLTKPAKPTENG